MKTIRNILNQSSFDHDDLVALLSAEGDDLQYLFDRAIETKQKYVGNAVYLRALIELSNFCKKNCYYCGIRAGNSSVSRYTVDEDAVIEAAVYADQHRYGSMVLQAGERSDKAYTEMVSKLLKQIMQVTNNRLGITLSLGEQSEETYRQWKEAGAKRYLLRIETSNRELYSKLHPADHSYDERLECIKTLQKLGYQVGTGVMIGMPFQSVSDLADDLLFFKQLNIDMIGMGPYIEHENTPLYIHKETLWSKEKRFEMSLKMVAILRLMMKDVNIAATTAMQTLHPQGRELAVKVGSNVIMPNLTPYQYRENYHLYQGKITVKDQPFDDQLDKLEASLNTVGAHIAFGQHGDSKHFTSKKEK